MLHQTMQQLSPSDLKADKDLPSEVKVLSTSSSQKKRARRKGNHRRGESFSKQGKTNNTLLQGQNTANKKVKRNQSMAFANGVGFGGGRATVQPPGVMSERNDAGLRKGEGELSKRGIEIAAAVKLETSLNQDLE